MHTPDDAQHAETTSGSAVRYDAPETIARYFETGRCL
jgi:hypothetical protein